MGYYASHDAQLIVLPDSLDALREVLLTHGEWFEDYELLTHGEWFEDYDHVPVAELLWQCLSEEGDVWDTPEDSGGIPGGLSTAGFGKAYQYAANDELMVAIAPYVMGTIDWASGEGDDERWRLRFPGDGTVTHYGGVVTVTYPADTVGGE